MDTSNTRAIRSGAGEAPEFIPGSSADFELELEPLHYIEYYDGGDLEEFEWRPLILIKLTEVGRLLNAEALWKLIRFVDDVYSYDGHLEYFK
jgi:hypothetical protein